MTSHLFGNRRHFGIIRATNFSNLKETDKTYRDRLKQALKEEALDVEEPKHCTHLSAFSVYVKANGSVENTP